MEIIVLTIKKIYLYFMFYFTIRMVATYNKFNKETNKVKEMNKSSTGLCKW